MPFTTSIYLASNSPRRRELLSQIGIQYELLLAPSPDGDDEPRLAGEPAALYVQRTARDKAERALAWCDKHHKRPILAADTCVMQGEIIFGKPTNSDDVYTTLRQLSGHAHEVHTSVVLHHNEQWFEQTSISRVFFKTLSDAEIMAYAATQEPYGKAGAYAIQGFAALFIEHIEGSYTGIMGLPLFETGQLFRQAGLLRMPS